MYKKCQMVLFVLLAGLLVCGIAMAQSDLGEISGYIKDQSGAVVPNAKITIGNKSGVERQATTNESGYYAITNVPPGSYTMTAEAAGFEKFQSSENKLDPSSQLVIDATLTVGSTSQTVNVTAAVATLQTEAATVQKLMTRQQIDALELNGRNPIFMANLVPGTRGGTLAALSFNFTQGPSNINGARTPESLITYDGAPAVRTRSNGTSIGAADVDSTQEIQILTADYAAEYGRSSGGQIRITSKSGSQDFHGEGYEYVRNTIFNANTWQRNASTATGLAATNFVAPDHYNQFGYNIGGPLYIPNGFNKDKSKVFWYWGQEWVRRVFTDQAALTVPTLRMRAGDFSELLNPSNFFYKKTVVIKDPKTGLPYVGNVIPAPGTAGGQTPASANGLGILNAWPAPNLATPVNGNQNWFEFASHPQDQRKDTIAIDVNLTDKQRLRFRRVYFAYFEYQPLDGGTNETPKYFNRPNYTYSLDHTWTLSPTMVNEVLLTYSQDIVHIPVNAAAFLDRTKGAAQCAGCFGTNYNYIFPVSTKLIPTRIPSVNMTNFGGLSGGPYPSHSGGPIVDLSDSLTWVRGTHTIKFGGLYEYSGENDNDEINVSACPTCTNNQNGQFLFTDGRAGGTGIAAANAALGLFDTYSELGNRAYTIFRGSMWEGFAQDGWRATQKLHLDYGVRYSVIVPYHARWGNMAVFDPSFYNPAQAVTVSPTTGLITGSPTIAQLYNGMVIPGTGFPTSAANRVPAADSGLYTGLFHGVVNHYSNVQYGDIQPRLGLAYQLDDKTVLRAGAGRFITRLGVSDSIFLGGNPPFQPNVSLSSGSVDTLGTTGANAIPLVVTTQSLAFKNPEAWAMNGTIEREMPFKSLLSVGYVGRRGLHLQREADINQPTTAVVAANPGVNINALRPYLGFSSIRETDNVANSWYHSLQVAWNRHFSGGYAFGVAYTFAHSMDDGSNQRDVLPDTYNAHMMWGPSEFDAHHILAINYLYQLPFYRGQQRGFAAKALGGWQISGITQFQTGLPCSVAAATDYAGVGLDANYGCGVNGEYWNQTGVPKIIGTFGNTGKWFDTSVFSKPAAGTFNLSNVRNDIYQPGFQNWNMGLFKTVPINERFRFQFRAEAFNVWNHPNWGGAAGGGVQFSPTSGTFGEVTTKGGAPGSGGERNIQLSLKLEF
ncbi:MAG TPA: carboxypeptidase regulatory-like domain-containing protein [Terriglobia bacterium]|nr:carboxypeptidase regulatory-like domain-containing protein [Terriglobia bacterium]